MKFILISLFFSPYFSFGQSADYSRYPDRLPDWLWGDQIRRAYIDYDTKQILLKKIDTLNIVWKEIDTSSYGNTLYKEIDAILSRNLSLLDLEKGSTLINFPNNNYFTVQLDPNFNRNDKEMLLNAVKLFLLVALDDDVLNEAYLNSIALPTPTPMMYDTIKKGDSLKEYSSAYTLLMKSRTRPLSVKQFKTQLNNALVTLSGDPSLLIISTYRGNPWWGRSWYNFFNYTNKHLARFSPSTGYLYIGLNTDSLVTCRRIPFWASKIAHEILHNLGYWHPNYANPAERDANNQGSNKAFIVAYGAVLKKAQELYFSFRGSN